MNIPIKPIYFKIGLLRDVHLFFITIYFLLRIVQRCLPV